MTRLHWGIENELHWALDVAFAEDTSRKRTGNAAQNFYNTQKNCFKLVNKG